MTSEAMTAALNRWCDEYCVADNARAELHQLLASPPSEQDGRGRPMSNDDLKQTTIAMAKWLDAVVRIAHDAGYRKRCSEQHIARAEAAALEAAARVAENGCLVPPDGGSPTEAERLMCEDIAKAIRALAPATTGDEAREALKKVAAQFRFYEREHRAKAAHAKADTNRSFAEMCESALRASERD